MAKFRILIAAGGTGGHLFPAMAVLEQIEALTETDASFVGSKNRIESRIVPEKGYDYTPMPIEGFSGISLKSLLLPFKILKSVSICKSLIKSFKPHAVLCTGAYISYPAGAAASAAKIPLFLMESNVNPGKAVKMLSAKADRIFTSFVETKEFFEDKVKSRIELTGNPVRKSLLNPPSRIEALAKFGMDRGRKTVLVFGGSLGAKSINIALEQNLEKIAGSDVQYIWQTGRNFSTEKQIPQNVKMLTFIEDMASAYAGADLVVSRSGAASTAEICVCGKSSILLPLPSAANNEQSHNAKALSEAGAAEIVNDTEASERLFELINDLINSEEKLKKMGKSALALSKPDAAVVCAKKILDYCRRKYR